MSDIEQATEILISSDLTSFANISSNLTSFANVIDVVLTKIDQYSTNLAFDLYYNSSITYPRLLTFASFISISLLLAVIGSYSTVRKPKNALEPNKNHPLFDPTDLQDLPDENMIVDGKSAAAMPVIAAIGLSSLYYAIKHVSKETLMYYLKNYVVFTSVGANFSTVDYLIKSMARQISYRFNYRFLKYFRFTISNDEGDYHPFGVEQNYFMDDSTFQQRIMKEEALAVSRSQISVSKQIFNFFISSSELFSIPIAVVITTLFHQLEENWLLSNIIGFSFAFFGITSIHISSTKVGFIMLSSLLIYDIYFVFNTDMMVTVAKGIDLPLKLMIPNAGELVIEGNKLPMAILGLGDIVIPSVFISHCLRYDLWKFHDTHPNYEFHHLQPYPKTYFIASLVGYVLGLATTMGVLEIYKQGQPALLYIVPSILSCVFITTLIKGEFKSFWNFNEENEDAIIGKSSLVSKETLRLLELDDEDDDDEDYIYQEDTVLIMDQYLDELDSEAEQEDDNELQEDDTAQFTIDESFDDEYKREPNQDRDILARVLLAEIDTSEDDSDTDPTYDEIEELMSDDQFDDEDKDDYGEDDDDQSK